MRNINIYSNVVDDENDEDDDYEPPPKNQCKDSPQIIPLPSLHLVEAIHLVSFAKPENLDFKLYQQKSDTRSSFQQDICYYQEPDVVIYT